MSNALDETLDENTEPLPVIRVETFDDTPEEPLEVSGRFSYEERRQIAVMSEAILLAQKQAEPLVVVVPPTEPETFAGTYSARPHWIDGFAPIVFAPFALIAMWFLAFIMGQMLVQILDQAIAQLDALPRLKTIHYQEWVTLWGPLVIAGAATLWALWMAIPSFLRWYFTRLIITETQVLVSVNVPGFIRNLIFSIDDHVEKIDRREVRSVTIARSGFAEFLGYATVSFETNVQADESFHNIRFVRNPDKIRELFPIHDGEQHTM